MRYSWRGLPARRPAAISASWQPRPAWPPPHPIRTGGRSQQNTAGGMPGHFLDGFINHTAVFPCSVSQVSPSGGSQLPRHEDAQAACRVAHHSRTEASSQQPWAAAMLEVGHPAPRAFRWLQPWPTPPERARTTCPSCCWTPQCQTPQVITKACGSHYQRNANQNHNEVPLHASQNGCHQKVYKQ